MSLQKRKERPKGLLKISRVLVCILFLCTLSCNSGTSSTSSSAGSSGTGTGWTITIQVGTNPLALSNTTTIMAIVKDRTGAPAPKGTNICMTAVRNGFLKSGATTVYTTLCDTTTDDLGQYILTYSAQTSTGTGIDRVEVSSQGVIATVEINVI